MQTPTNDDAGIARRASKHLLQQAGNADAFENQRGLERRQHRLQRRAAPPSVRETSAQCSAGRIRLRTRGVDHDVSASFAASARRAGE